MKTEQILIDALYQIACGCHDDIQTSEQMVTCAVDALIKFMKISGLKSLTVTKGVNNKEINNINLN